MPADPAPPPQQGPEDPRAHTAPAPPEVDPSVVPQRSSELMEEVEPDAPDGLSAREAKDEILVESLAQGMSFPAAGHCAGYTSRTVSRRMADPRFAARVSRRRGERVAQVTGALASMSEDALGVLRSTMAEGTTSEKLRAAQLTLTLMVRLRHDTEFEERFALIEGRLGRDRGDAPR